MASKPPLVVMDTCVYFDVLYYGQGTSAAQADRAERSKSILVQIETEGWRAGLAPVVKVELNSSTHLGGHHPSATRHIRRTTLDAYFDSARYVLLENDERVTTLAARLARTCELKAPDALIAASAVAYGADYLYSWDSDLLKLDKHTLMRSTRVIAPPPVTPSLEELSARRPMPEPIAQLDAAAQEALFSDGAASDPSATAGSVPGSK